MALPVPADGQVDVWIARVGQLGESERLACEALLDDAERVRLANFALEHARTQFLTAYCLLRSVLSLYRPRHPSEWAFTTNAYGRPRLAGGQAADLLHFNLSHTHGMATCAISGTEEIGIDVEWMDRNLDFAALAPGVLAPPELARLHAASGAEKRDLFFSFWTLKEAYIKARGMGMSLPLKELGFEIDGSSPPKIFFQEGLEDAPARWSFSLFSPAPSHRVAAAASFPSVRGPMEVAVRMVEIPQLVSSAQFNL